MYEQFRTATIMSNCKNNKNTFNIINTFKRLTFTIIFFDSVWAGFSYNETKIISRNVLFCSLKTDLFMQLVEGLIHQIAIAYFQKINCCFRRRFKFYVLSEKKFHSFLFWQRSKILICWNDKILFYKFCQLTNKLKFNIVNCYFLFNLKNNFFRFDKIILF